jgi:Fur family ferric uptake transcriptional regulator
MRTTRQREVILDDLRSVTSHPTADEVYEMSRRRLPDISLATVYRNLEALADMGVVGRLSLAGTKRRYDGNVSRHYHSRCSKCGRVFDLPVEESRSVDDALTELRSMEGVEDIDIEIKRVCAGCSAG